MAYTTIDDPTIYFNTVLFTGTASGNKAVTGVGFQPDWVWTKNRVDAYGHNLYDSVRGVGKYLNSNESAAESTSATSMVSFDSDGFTVGTGDNVQYSSNNGVSWNWKAGGSASSNSNGSITSSVSVDTTAGFSIVAFTGNGTSGATVGHGLSSAPKVIILKDRDTGINSWVVGHNSLGWTKYLYLNKTDAIGTTSGFWNDTAPTSSVFTLGNNDTVNGSGGLNIAYCFAEKKGYSKFGSYTGNGNADGTFVYTGFKPSFVMLKDSSNAGYNWLMYDNKRLGYNGGSRYLIANTIDPEGGSSDNLMDFTSNGFKPRSADQNINRTHTYIYMAFAENPFVTSSGVPATAR